MATTVLTDVIEPEIFTPYVQQQTEEKSNLLASGAMARDEEIDRFLAGGGSTFNIPSWNDLPNDASNVDDDTGTAATPNNTTAAQEIGVRMNRNNHWGSLNIVSILAGSDPMVSIGNRVADYWRRQLQLLMVQTVTGVFADNDAAPTGGDTHTAGDMTVDITGVYSAGVTDFSAEAFIDALATMGDSMDDLGLVMVHSVVYSRMKKNNLIDFVADASNPDAARVPFFHNRRVIVDDGMPVATNDYDTWIFGLGALRLGVGTPRVPTAVARNELTGNGGGDEVLTNRVMWCIHPTGHAFIGTPASIGGPTNAELAAATSWSRRYAERKQIKIARLVTTEA